MEATEAHGGIEDHLEVAISIDALAALVGLRRRQFADCFRATFGISAYNYVLQRRVARGAVLLARGRSIAEAAMSVGFCNQSHFTAAYRRQLGITPSAGRRLR
jgi:AraC family transcriptional regulator